jgi:hypothetical protein
MIRLVGAVLGLHIAGGATAALVTAVALVRLGDCVSGATAQLSGCMRITCRELGIVRASWREAIARGLADAGLTVAEAARYIGTSRQYVERLLADAATIPLEHLRALSELAGVDLALHTTTRTTWPSRQRKPRP